MRRRPHSETVWLCAFAFALVPFGLQAQDGGALGTPDAASEAPAEVDALDADVGASVQSEDPAPAEGDAPASPEGDEATEEAAPPEGDDAQETTPSLQGFGDDFLDGIELRMAGAAQEAAERAAAEVERAEREAERARLEAAAERFRQTAGELDARIRQLAENDARRAAEPAPAPTQELVVRAEVDDDDDELIQELAALADGLRGGSRSVFALSFFALFFALIAFGLRRFRDRFRSRGILPALLAFLHLLTRALVVVFLGAVVVRFLPPRASLILLFAFAGLAFALGWTVRDLLPDLLAGVVLAFERRLTRGMWISTEDFAGEVVHVGLRSATLRDAQGHDVAVPNRFLVGVPVATDRERERAHDVTLRIDQTSYGVARSSDLTRRAIMDAVLSSPWVAPDQEPLVFRDPEQPELWRVRARLLDARFGVHFEGDLLERAEAILMYEPNAQDAST